uniref:Uncharacterized protein n=1 Tax=Panagrolaimus davidi TaxID=227884 RepID=A0A914PAH5_9BILA
MAWFTHNATYELCSTPHVKPSGLMDEKCHFIISANEGKPYERLIKKYNGNEVAFQIIYSILAKRRNNFYSFDPQKFLAIIHSSAILAFIVRFYFPSKRIFFSTMTESEEDPLSRKVTPVSAEIQTNNVLCFPQVLWILFWFLCYNIVFMFLVSINWSIVYGLCRREEPSIHSTELLDEKCFFIMTLKYYAYVDERNLGTLDSNQTKFFQHYDYHIFNRSAYYKIDPQFILGIIYTIATIVSTLRCFITAINGYFRNGFIFVFDTYLMLKDGDNVLPFLKTDGSFKNDGPSGWKLLIILFAIFIGIYAGFSTPDFAYSLTKDSQPFQLLDEKCYIIGESILEVNLILGKFTGRMVNLPKMQKMPPDSPKLRLEMTLKV